MNIPKICRRVSTRWHNDPATPAAQPPLPLPMGEVAERSEDGEGAGSCKYEKMRRLQLGTLSVTAFSRASSPKGRAKGRAMPARRTEITM